MLPPAEASSMRSWGAPCSVTQGKGNYAHELLLSTSRDISNDTLALLSNPADKRLKNIHTPLEGLQRSSRKYSRRESCPSTEEE